MKNNLHFTSIHATQHLDMIGRTRVKRGLIRPSSGNLPAIAPHVDLYRPARSNCPTMVENRLSQDIARRSWPLDSATVARMSCMKKCGCRYCHAIPLPSMYCSIISCQAKCGSVDRLERTQAASSAVRPGGRARDKDPPLLPSLLLQWHRPGQSIRNTIKGKEWSAGFFVLDGE